MPKQKVNRWLARNRRIRSENDFNRIMCEYVTFKYGVIAKEVCTFYDQLRDKYPAKNFYKGSKGFRTWVRDQIKTYVDEHPSSGDEDVSDANETSHLLREDVSDENETGHLLREDVSDENETGHLLREGQLAAQVVETELEEDVLSQAVREAGFDELQPTASIHEEQQQPQLIEVDNSVNIIIGDNIHEEQRQQQLNELDNVVNQIIADLEAGQDEGIGMDLFQSEEIPETWDNEPLVEWW